MSLILVAEQESRYVERIRDALGSEGWRVRFVGGREEALAAAATEPPQLVLVSCSLSGAEDLLSTFSKRSGGPGVLGLVAEDGSGGETATAKADEVLNKPFTDQDLRLAVRRGMAPTSRPAEAFGAELGNGPQLTSEDIFGDLVAEVESELTAAAPPPAPQAPPPQPPAAPEPPAVSKPPAAPAPSHAVRRSDQLDRALEETLSGLRAVDPRPRPADKTVKRRSVAATEVDALLSETLSGLDLSRTRSRKKPAPEGDRRPPEPPPPSPPVATRRKEIDFSALESLAREVRGEPAAKPAATPPPTADATPPPVLTELELPELPGLAAPSAPAAPTAAEAAVPKAQEPRVAEAPTAAAGATLEATPDGLRFGQYTLLDRIAVGGMAEVWKARMTGVEGFQKTVAIKKILPHLTDNDDFVNMFIDEAKLAAQLSHPNIIHIYDLGKIGDHFYIAMEYVEGKNLRNLLNESARKALPIPRGLALLVAARLASALDHAHRKKDFEGRELGLVHRDVSPQNVLLSSEGDIKLCDFGIAKAVSKASQTQMGALKGKLQYMSPEQAWGKPVDSRSDLFSLGSLLFEMLTGRRLFAGDSEISVLEAVRQCRVQAPRNLDPGISEAVEAVVLKALEQNPDRRFATAGEMQHQLEELLYAMRPAPSQADLADYLAKLAEAPEVPPESRAATTPPRQPATGVGEEPSASSAPVVSADPVEALRRELARDKPLQTESPRREPPRKEPPREEATPVRVAEPAATPPAQSGSRVDHVEALAAVDADELEIEEGGSRGKRVLLAVIILLVIVGVAAGYLLWTRGTLQGLLGIGGAETSPDGQLPPASEAPASPEVPDGTGTEGVAPEGEVPADPVDAAPGEASLESSAPAGWTAAAPGGGRPTGTPTDPTPLQAPADRKSPTPARELRDRPAVPERRLAQDPPTAGGGGNPAAPKPDPAAAATVAPAPAPAAATKTSGAGPSRAEGGEEIPAADEGKTAAPLPAAVGEDEPRPDGPMGADRPTVTGASGSASQAPPAAVKAAPPKPTPPPPPAEPEVREGQLVGPGPGVVPPVLVSFEKPQYPPMARRLRVEGDVVLSLLVDETGKVAEIRVTKGVRPTVGINEAAVEAARSAEYRPATKNGIRVKMWTTLKIPFKL